MDLLGEHSIDMNLKEARNITLGVNKIVISSDGGSLTYRRYVKDEVVSDLKIVSAKNPVTIGIFPIPALHTPKKITRNLYLKFKTAIVIDPKCESTIYAKIPIEVGIYRQIDDEEILIDVFSIIPQKYALYGTPENGIVCRYFESEVGSNPEVIMTSKYEEASIKIKVDNNIDNVIKISKVIIPLEGVILDHLNDDAVLSSTVNMVLDSTFGKDIVNVRLIEAKVKRIDKTSASARQETLTFLMDSGY